MGKQHTIPLKISWAAVPVVLGSLLLASCDSAGAGEPSVTFTKLPPSGDGSPSTVYSIEGRVTGGKPGQQIVLYASSGEWWVQPSTREPFTNVRPDHTWTAQTHPGSSYAALLVRKDYQPRPKIDALPVRGGAVLAVVSALGPALEHPVGKTVTFRGYEWQARDTPNDPGGSQNSYDPANAWTDALGLLHLRIAGEPGHWSSAEVKLSRSLGYGSYRFVIRDVSHLEPAVVFTMLATDDTAPSREMDIEISHWGELSTRNSQFVIQPYYVPANTIQFQSPAGQMTFMLRWTPGQAWFRAYRGAVSRWESTPVSEHVFTSAVPPAGNELVHMNLYVFSNKNNPLRHGTEVVVENFEYLP
jgi:hypothetical protein